MIDAQSVSEDHQHALEIGNNGHFCSFCSADITMTYDCRKQHCKFRGNSVNALRQHVNKEHPPEPFNCFSQGCEFKCDSRMDMWSHLSKFHAKGIHQHCLESQQLVRGEPDCLPEEKRAPAVEIQVNADDSDYDDATTDAADRTENEETEDCTEDAPPAKRRKRESAPSTPATEQRWAHVHKSTKTTKPDGTIIESSVVKYVYPQTKDAFPCCADAYL